VEWINLLVCGICGEGYPVSVMKFLSGLIVCPECFEELLRREEKFTAFLESTANILDL